MKVLALETSGWSGSAGIFDDDRVVAVSALPEKTRTAVGLAPLIQSLLADAGLKAEDVELVAVTSGPGSFTGLRVGITTAKTFAYAVNAQVAAVNTLDAIAFGGFFAYDDARGDRLVVVMDAQRKQLFVAEYTCAMDGDRVTMKTESDCKIVDGKEWLDNLDPMSRVAGPGLMMKLGDGQSVLDALQSSERSERVLAAEHWQPTAASIGRLAAAQYAAGQRDDLWKLAPQYFRLSAAEENAASKKK